MSEHVPAVESSFLNPGYWATCSCGWRSDFAYMEMSSASLAAQKHAHEARLDAANQQ